jgi:hypothetical protein
MKGMSTRLKEISAKKLIIISVLILLIAALIMFAPRIYQVYKDRQEHAAFERKWEKENKERKELEIRIGKLKEWPVRDYVQIGAKELRMETKWADGKMFYKFNVTLIPGNNKILKKRYSSDGFILDFVDADGFKVYSFRISLASMTTIMDENGNTTEFNVNDKLEVSATEYQKFEAWSPGWNF